MLKIMRSNKLKRFIAVLFILLSVFSMCFSVAAKAEAVAVGVGAAVVIGALLTACGIKFANSADVNRAVSYVYQTLSDDMRLVVSGLVSLCEGYQKARLQIPFSVYQTFSNLLFSLFPCSSSTGGSMSLDFSRPINTSSVYMSYCRNGMTLPADGSSLGSVFLTTNASGVFVPPQPLFFLLNFGTASFSFYRNDSCQLCYTSRYSFFDGAVMTFDGLIRVGEEGGTSLPAAKLNGTNLSKEFKLSAPCVSVNGSSVTFVPSGIGTGGPSAYGGLIGFTDNTVSNLKMVFGSLVSTELSAIYSFGGEHYAASLGLNEDVLNYGVSRNPSLSTNPDCSFPQTVDGSKDVYMDIPALKDTSLDDLITKNPADVATPADTKVENPTLVEGADTNVGGDVTVPEDASWLDKILAWLKALLDGILSIPGVISKGIAGVLEGIKAIPAAFAKWFESIIEGIKAIGLSFTDWLSKLIEGFKSLLLSLFEPTISLDEAFAALKAKALAKFPTDGLIDSISAFRDYLSGLGDTPPSFTFVYMGNTCTIAPFDWLSGYRRYWIAFASFFMWFGFIRRTIKRMPQLLGGIT